jgi:hypothetical protein
MRWLPEKVGFVGGNCIDHVQHLIFHPIVAKQKITVFFIRRHMQRGQSFLQAAFQHYFFGQWHFYAVGIINIGT